MNEQEKLPEFFDFCKEYILEHIDDYEGQSEYACDLGFTITQYMLCDGTFTYSTAVAMRYMIEWFYEADKYSDYEKINFGKRSNPFSNIELFLAKMVSEGVRSILSQCEFLDTAWDEEIELTPDVIAIIKEQVGELDYCELF